MPTRLSNVCGLIAMIVTIGGCSKTDPPLVDPPRNSPTFTVTGTSTDLRKLSAAELAAKIKKAALGEGFTSVSLTSEGANSYAGTATTAEGKDLQLSVTVTEDTITYESKAKGSDKYDVVTIKQSSNTFESRSTSH